MIDDYLIKKLKREGRWTVCPPTKHQPPTCINPQTSGMGRWEINQGVEVEKRKDYTKRVIVVRKKK